MDVEAVGCMAFTGGGTRISIKCNPAQTMVLYRYGGT